MSQTSHSPILDHLGLVAGMFEALGIAEVIDKATQQNPARRLVTAGHAVKALVLNGLGFVHQPLSLVPHFFQHKPTSRRIAPAMTASHLNDDTLGRALDTLYAYGVTELDRLIAATAAKRLGLTPTCTPLDRTSFHGDGRYHSDAEPSDKVRPLPPGSSRAPRPDLNQVLLDLMVEQQAGMPGLLPPLSGQSRETTAVGQMVRDHLTQRPMTYGTTSVVADSARSSADNLHTLADTGTKWIPRVPATWTEAKAVLAQATPETRLALQAGSRDDAGAARYGGVEQRWLVLHSAHRQAQVQRTVDTRWRKHREQEAHALQKFCSTAWACEAEAKQA
jgi:transposase